MNAVSTLFVLFAAGVNYGWQPASDNSSGLEYTVQVEPELLDALQRGDAVPIESSVPADIGPIRKVRITVGHGDLPRQSLAAVKHTAYFAGQGELAPVQPDPSLIAQYDKYAAPAGGAGVAPPPDFMQRAQSAVTESGTAISQGFEAGIQAAGQQMSRAGSELLDSTRGVGQDIGRQAEQFMNNPSQQMQSVGNDVRAATDRSLHAVGNQLQQVTSPYTNSLAQPDTASSRAQNAVAPPPSWPQATGNNQPTYAGSGGVGGAGTIGSAAATSAPMRTATGWTSMGSNVAPPPLVAPNLATTPNGGNTQFMRTANGAGPGFPATSSTAGAAGGYAPPGVNPSNAQNPNAASNWNFAGGADTATISRAGNAPAVGNDGRGSGLVSVQPVGPNVQNPQQSTGQLADPFAGFDTWPRQQAPGNQASPAGSGDLATTPNAAQPNWLYGAGQTPNQGATPGQYAAGQIPSGQYTAGTMPPQQNPYGGSMSSTPPSSMAQQGYGSDTLLSSQGNQPPWAPFVAVCLTLVGSLSANLFLGWSYLDARQRYQLLVRKTADTFRRVTGVAA